MSKIITEEEIKQFANLYSSYFNLGKSSQDFLDDSGLSITQVSARKIKARKMGYEIPDLPRPTIKKSLADRIEIRTNGCGVFPITLSTLNLEQLRFIEKVPTLTAEQREAVEHYIRQEIKRNGLNTANLTA